MAGLFHAIANIHVTKSTFNENSSYCVFISFLKYTNCKNNQNKPNQINMQTISSQISQLCSALNTMEPAVCLRVEVGLWMCM